MILRVTGYSKRKIFLLLPSVSCAFSYAVSADFSCYISTLSCPSPLGSSHSTTTGIVHHKEQFIDSTWSSEVDVLIAKVRAGSSNDEFLQSLMHDQVCSAIQVSHNLVDRLLHRFKDDWRSALCVFRWAESHPGYKPLQESYDMLVDILGKTKQLEKMKMLVEEMRQCHLVRLSTIAKVMRRLAGAGEWEDAVRTFDDLGSFGLEKNTESMNLLLDTLCKEKKS